MTILEGDVVLVGELTGEGGDVVGLVAVAVAVACLGEVAAVLVVPNGFLMDAAKRLGS